MPITNEQYLEYAQKMSEKDRSNLDSTKVILTEFKVALRKAKDDLTSLKNSLPSIPTYTMNSARSSIEGLYQQIISYSSQVDFNINNIDSLLTQLGGANSNTNGE